MTDRDAFGRPIEGAGPSIQPLGTTDTTPSAQPPGGGRSDGSGLRRFLWWFVAVDLIAIVAVALVLFSGGSSDDDLVVIPPSASTAQSSSRDSGTADDVGSEPPAKSKPAVAPAGFNASSLLRPANFEDALAQARALHQGSPLMVRAEAARMDLQLARPDGTLVIMQVPASGAATVVTKVAGAAKGRATMTWSEIDPGAPQRLARATNSTPASGPRSTAYVVFLEQTRRWVLYRESGSGFIGDASGRGAARIPGT